ncbi:MAG: hypothetical protein FJ361_03370 [Gemmatimonadetes bacterium]|nr:hypothetical protein [Gemmatimonadota bacterium]
MSPKVLPDSLDIHDDQARVLVDHLADAARRIVAEEERLEQEMRVREEQATQAERTQTEKEQQAKVGFIAGVLLVVVAFFSVPAIGALGVGAAIWAWNARQAAQAAAEVARTNWRYRKVFKQEHTDLRRDYKVRRLGVAWVPVASQVPLEGGHFIVDHSGSTAERQFSLNSVKDPSMFVSSISALEGMVGALPIVEGSQAVEDVDTSDLSRSIQNVPLYDYLGTMDRSMRDATYLLNDLRTETVALPVLDPAGPLARALDEHGTTEPAAGARLDVFPTDAHDAGIAAFTALNAQRRAMEGETAQFEEFLRTLMHRLAATVQVITKSKIASTTTLAEYGNRGLFATLKASYNHYSPQLEAEEIERIRGESFDYQASVQGYRPFALKQSSRVRYDVLSGNWVAEDGRRTSFPFGVHQIHEEVLAPIVEQLMQETRLERLRIYENIKDQKLDYLNQWHRDTDDFYGRNRAEGSNLINLMQGSLTEFIASYNQYEAFEKTRQSMRSGEGSAEVSADGIDAASLVAYRAKMESFTRQQAEFNDFAERLKEEITERAREFGFIEYYDASLRDGPARRFAEAMHTVDALEERRRPLLSVNPLFASTAELPPAPQLDPMVQDTLRFDLEAFARESLAPAGTPAAPPAA